MKDARSGDATTFEVAEVSSAVRPLTLPEVIDGRYRVLGRVGAGGMGVVLRAEDLPELVQCITARNPAADLVILSRDLGALTRTLGERDARHLVPKPVNTHVLASVLGRTSRASRKDTKP